MLVFHTASTGPPPSNLQNKKGQTKTSLPANEMTRLSLLLSFLPVVKLVKPKIRPSFIICPNNRF
jgi:hypothetical protein